MRECIDHKCEGEHMIGWEQSNDRAERRMNTSHGIALSEKNSDEHRDSMTKGICKIKRAARAQ